MQEEIVKAGNIANFDCERLKQKYLECFHVHAGNVTTWREVVTVLMDRGCSRALLVNWGMEAGYARTYVSEVLTRILCHTGHRERKKGAGRKPSTEVLALLAYSREHYGENFLNMLRAAWRTGQAQLPKNEVPNAQKVGLALLGVHNNDNGLLWVHNKEREGVVHQVA